MDDLKRNGSGYYDPTAYKAIRKFQNGGVSNMNIRKGEIWEVEHGKDSKLALVIAWHVSYCSVILLNDEPRESRDIRLNARGMKYSESGMVSYKFCDAFVDFVRTTTDEEFEDVMNKVSESLGLNPEVTCNGSDDRRIDDLKMKLEGAERELDEAKAKFTHENNVCHALQVELEKKQKENLNLEEDIELFKAEIERLRNSKPMNSDPDEVAVLKAQIEIYKQQNEKMFERLIGA